MKKQSLIRTIYLYSFSLLGLVLLVIGCVRFVDLALRTFVFTAADQQERSMYQQPVMAPVALEKVQSLAGQKEVKLTPEEEQAVKAWLVDYQNWKDNNAKVDYLASQRSRDISFNLALILIGLPLYLFHWLTIRRENKQIEE